MSYRPHWKPSIAVFAISVLLVITGGVAYIIRNELFQFVISKVFYTSPTMHFIDEWTKMPMPIISKFYFFNWSNPEEFSENSTTPILNEVGPYTFREYQKKTNVTWNQNMTVSYRIHRKWYFDQELSLGSPDDVITTLNVIPAAGAYFLREWNGFINRAASLLMTSLGHKLSVKKSISELMFDGYNDPLLSISRKFYFAEYEKFGYFFKFNDSSELDGLLNVATGKEDISQVARVLNWNYEKKCSCSPVDGTTGEQFRPGLDKTNVTIFSPWMCRPVLLRFVDEVYVQGTKGYKYVAGDENINMDPGSDCVDENYFEPPGVINISSCHMGAPLFISYPHFHRGDPYYRSQIMGMEPDSTNHESYIIIEPTLGIPLEGKIRLQLNILVDRNPHIRIYRKISKTYFPVFWAEKSVAIPPYHASLVNFVLHFPLIIEIISLYLIIFGLLILVTLLACRLKNRGLITPRHNFSFVARYRSRRSSNKSVNLPLVNREVPVEEPYN